MLQCAYKLENSKEKCFLTNGICNTHSKQKQFGKRKWAKRKRESRVEWKLGKNLFSLFEGFVLPSIITSLHNCPLEDFQKVMKKVRGLWQQGVCVVHSAEVCEAGRMEGVWCQWWCRREMARMMMMQMTALTMMLVKTEVVVLKVILMAWPWCWWLQPWCCWWPP